MSLLMVRKSAPALSLATAKDAQDANGDEVIAQKNGCKLVHNTLNDGYWFYTKSGAGWGLTATNKVAAVNEFNRLVDSAKDAAADAAPEFKVGDKIWVAPSYGANLNIGYGWNVGVVKRVGTGYIDVDFKGQVISVPAPYCARVNSSGKPVFDSAAGAAQDSGNYTTNIEALLKTAYSALNKAESVVRVVLRNISNAFDKVQDAQAKSSLNNLEKDWSACEREVWAALEKVERIYVPSGVGVPNKKKLSPEDRKFIEAFFG